MIETTMVEETLVKYWCPTMKKHTFCSDPCPDGTPHERVEYRGNVTHVRSTLEGDEANAEVTSYLRERAFRGKPIKE